MDTAFLALFPLKGLTLTKHYGIPERQCENCFCMWEKSEVKNVFVLFVFVGKIRNKNAYHNAEEEKKLYVGKITSEIIIINFFVEKNRKILYFILFLFLYMGKI